MPPRTLNLLNVKKDIKIKINFKEIICILLYKKRGFLMNLKQGKSWILAKNKINSY